MGKLPYGVPSRHVNASQGADTDLMKFYSTQNSTTYGQRFSNFQPRPGRHTGTGYLSNFRPGVYYSPNLDQLDNPVLGRIISDNYSSVTKKGFQPSKGPDGREALPYNTTQVGSGFVRQKAVTIPTVNDVRSVCVDTRVASAPADIMPRAKPHLQNIQSKDPVELENGGYGPAYMSTETTHRFQGKQPLRSDVSRNAVGDKEGSGFTHAHNVEPITYHPDGAFQGDMPSYFTYRPTGFSIMKTDFRPSKYAQGAEPFPQLANRSEKDTGFTKGTKARPVFVNRVLGDAYDKASDIPGPVMDRIKKGDPAEYLNTVNPNNYSSINAKTFLGVQRPSASESDRLGRTTSGTKEPSGYVENNDRFVQTADNRARFITHYDTKFVDRTPKGLDREGHTWGGVQHHKEDGFTKSTRVHSFGDEYNSTATLRRLAPYVAKSVQAQNPFFDDHTHDNKLSFKAPMAMHA